MRTSIPALGILLLTIAAGCGGGEEPPAEQAAAVGEAPEAAETAEAVETAETAEPVEAESVVAYDSETHGAVEVDSVSDSPVDWFDVLDQDGHRAFAGNPLLLGNSVELPPGTYVVDVNRTQRTITVEAGKKIVLRTGDLIVRGQPESAFWYPLQGEVQTLTANPPLLNRARALFPGTYTVRVHTSVGVADRDLGAAEVTAGRTTVLEH